MEQKATSTNNSNEKATNWMLLPPAKDVCQECAVKHKPEEPHDATSLYYQYSFHAKHGRWPGWLDAMSHCSEEMKAAWTKELKKRGLWKE